MEHQGKIIASCIFLLILISASFYQTSLIYFSGSVEEQITESAGLEEQAVVVETGREADFAPITARGGEISATDRSKGDKATKSVDTSDSKKVELKPNEGSRSPRRKRKKAPQNAKGSCTLLMVVALLLPSDSTKREKILLELSMAFTSAYLAHKDKGGRNNKLCFGIITDNSTTVTISDPPSARRSLQGEVGEAILNDLEYFRYEDIWHYVDKGRPQSGFNTLGRFKGYRNVLEAESSKEKEVRRNIVFIDSDILFLKDLFSFYTRREPGGEPFDVGLTYRMMPKFPINTGVMYFHAERTDKGAQFMKYIVETYAAKQYPPKMLGDQMVMNDVLEDLGRKVDMKKKINRQRVFNSAGIEIVLVHIDHWNFSPAQYCRVPRKAHVLHFKGELKRKMLEYFHTVEEHLLSGEKTTTKLTQTLNKMQAEGRRVRPCKY